MRKENQPRLSCAKLVLDGGYSQSTSHCGLVQKWFGRCGPRFGRCGNVWGVSVKMTAYIGIP